MDIFGSNSHIFCSNWYLLIVTVAIKIEISLIIIIYCNSQHEIVAVCVSVAYSITWPMSRLYHYVERRWKMLKSMLLLLLLQENHEPRRQTLLQYSYFVG